MVSAAVFAFEIACASVLGAAPHDGVHSFLVFLGYMGTKSANILRAEGSKNLTDCDHREIGTPS